jgi:hypothetical protein
MPAPKDPVKYAEFCERMRQITSESNKKLPSDPNWRERHIIGIKKRDANPEWRRNITESNRLKAKDPEYIMRLRDACNKRYQDSENREKQSAVNRRTAKSQLWKINHKEGAARRAMDPEYRMIRRVMLEKRNRDPDHIKKVIEGLIGGFWYGNVRYPAAPIYCELWKDVNPRVHAFFDYKCCLCGRPENGRSHRGHHVFYVKEACCWYNESGEYYTNLNAPDHPEKDYLIGKNPNYFVILCGSCHGKTNGNFANRKKWADYFREMIDTRYNSECFLKK